MQVSPARPQIQTYQTRALNPTSHARLAMTIRHPGAVGPRPGVVLVPGGRTDGQLFFGTSGVAERFARAGYVAVHFDPDGRGSSEGVEDDNGRVQQDALAAVLQATIDSPLVSRERIALVACGFGLTMATGVLIRYPDLPVRFLVDWQGLVSRDEILESLGGTVVPTAGIADERWWQERDPLAMLRLVPVGYQRVQTTPTGADAGQAAMHAIRAATHRRFGGEGIAPWTRLNGNPANQVYEGSAKPWWLSPVPAEIACLAYLLELMPPDRRWVQP